MTDEKIVRDAIWAELGALSTRVEELLARAEAAEARCATLEAALRAARHELDQWVLADNREMAYRVERAEAIIDAALAAATPPAEPLHQDALARCATLEAALAEIEAIQPRLVGWLRDNGIVFRRAPLSAPPESDDERWEQIAFSIYTHVCEADSAARAALAASQPAEKEGTAFERSLLRADIKAGNADAAEAQLQRIKRLEAEAPPAEKEGT